MCAFLLDLMRGQKQTGNGKQIERSAEQNTTNRIVLAVRPLSSRTRLTPRLQSSAKKMKKLALGTDSVFSASITQTSAPGPHKKQIRGGAKGRCSLSRCRPKSFDASAETLKNEGVRFSKEESATFAVTYKNSNNNSKLTGTA